MERAYQEVIEFIAGGAAPQNVVAFRPCEAAKVRVRGKISAMSVQEIEAAIAQLPRSEVAELVAWLENYHHQIWDRQIEDDLEAGRLDALIAEAESEYQAGHACPL